MTRPRYLWARPLCVACTAPSNCRIATTTFPFHLLVVGLSLEAAACSLDPCRSISATSACCATRVLTACRGLHAPQNNHEPGTVAGLRASAVGYLGASCAMLSHDASQNRLCERVLSVCVCVLVPRCLLNKLLERVLSRDVSQMNSVSVIDPMMRPRYFISCVCCHMMPSELFAACVVP